VEEIERHVEDHPEDHAGGEGDERQLDDPEDLGEVAVASLGEPGALFDRAGRDVDFPLREAGARALMTARLAAGGGQVRRVDPGFGIVRTADVVMSVSTQTAVVVEPNWAATP
jgi:hypothetical protein